VLYLGAGDGESLDGLLALRAERLWLLEGDADLANELRRHARRRPTVAVLEEAVSPDGGVLDWLGFNLRHLNGPIDPAGLRAYYPRLKKLASVPLDSIALSELLRRLAADLARGGPALLVIDLPGQEHALLDSLPDELLNLFGWVLLRGCSVPLRPGIPTADLAVADLLKRCFRVVHSEIDSEPLWPVHLLRFDTEARDEVLRRQRQLVLERELAECNTQIAQLRLEQAQALEHQQSLLETQAAQNAALALERDENLRLRAELLARADERALEREVAFAEVQALTEARAELERETQSRAAQIDALSQALEVCTSERDMQAGAVAEGQHRIEALTRVGADLEHAAQQRDAQLEALTQAKAALEASVAESVARLDQLTQSFEARAGEWARDREALLAESQRQTDALRLAHGEQARQAEERLAEARQQNEALSGQVQHLEAGQRALEAASAQQQAEAEANAEALRLARDEQTRLAQERQEQVQTLTQAGVDLRLAAQKRQGQMEALSLAKAGVEAAAADSAAQVDRLSQALDAQVALTAEQGAAARVALAANAELAQQLADVQADHRSALDRLAEKQAQVQQLEADQGVQALRQRVLQDEMVKAEAQIDLIKELLLREPGLR
jgi:hypothetical protein